MFISKPASPFLLEASVFLGDSTPELTVRSLEYSDPWLAVPSRNMKRFESVHLHDQNEPASRWRVLARRPNLYPRQELKKNLKACHVCPQANPIQNQVLRILAPALSPIRKNLDSLSTQREPQILQAMLRSGLPQRQTAFVPLSGLHPQSQNSSLPRG